MISLKNIKTRDQMYKLPIYENKQKSVSGRGNEVKLYYRCIARQVENINFKAKTAAKREQLNSTACLCIPRRYFSPLFETSIVFIIQWNKRKIHSWMTLLHVSRARIESFNKVGIKIDNINNVQQSAVYKLNNIRKHTGLPGNINLFVCKLCW